MTKLVFGLLLVGTLFVGGTMLKNHDQIIQGNTRAIGELWDDRDYLSAELKKVNDRIEDKPLVIEQANPVPMPKKKPAPKKKPPQPKKGPKHSQLSAMPVPVPVPYIYPGLWAQ